MVTVAMPRKQIKDLIYERKRPELTRRFLNHQPARGRDAREILRTRRTLSTPQAWHSELRDVYHNNDECTEGNNIERENRLPGTGGKRLCSHCALLNGGSENGLYPGTLVGIKTGSVRNSVSIL